MTFHEVLQHDDFYQMFLFFDEEDVLIEDGFTKIDDNLLFSFDSFYIWCIFSTVDVSRLAVSS